MHQEKNQNEIEHAPVLANEVLKYLDPKDGEAYLDLTAGYGGHAVVVLDRTASRSKAVLVDRDEAAIKRLREKFGDQIELRQQDFLQASRELLAAERKFDIILADLGVSSPHLNEAGRGFSIQRAGPLDMRMDRSQALTAAEIVNTYDEDRLAELIRRYGEEPKARQIARLMVGARSFSTTDELAEVVAKAWSTGRSRTHPATRTFQALRIAVNAELEQVENSLPIWLKLLNPGGRIAVISFHSLEDRLVKQAFAEASAGHYDAELKLLTKRPVTATSSEIVHNPRARSAKLRAAVKIKNIEREL